MIYRIIVSALKLGFIIAFGLLVFMGADIASTYSLGVFAGALYLFLLGKKVDTIGAKYSAIPTQQISSNSTDTTQLVMDKANLKMVENLSKGRLLVPLIVVLLLAGKNYLADGVVPQYLKVIPQSQFVSSMGGFLTVRFSIFLSEVTKEIRLEDWIGLVPGSLAIAIRNSLANQKGLNNNINDLAIPESYKVVYITGPAAAGRNQLISNLLRKEGVYSKKDFRVCKLLTTDLSYSIENSDW